ncbi:aldehyde dehydrogenase family protein [Streptomyces scabiei]|uniref:aldehyde dehydrogenase family protein n=1 Tax=Streptomyces scabiei TaxID=1930 RepID=UPI0036BD8AF7
MIIRPGEEDIPDRDTVIASVPTGLWVGGEQVPAVDGRAFRVFAPADGQVVNEAAAAGSADGVRTLDAAAKAQPEWAATPARGRAKILRRARELVIGRRDDFALLMTLEMRKPLAESYGEVDFSAEFLRWFFRRGSDPDHDPDQWALPAVSIR